MFDLINDLKFLSNFKVRPAKRIKRGASREEEEEEPEEEGEETVESDSPALKLDDSGDSVSFNHSV